VVYKLESYELFRKMVDKLNKEVISFLVKAQLPVTASDQTVRQAPVPRQEAPKNVQTSRTEIPNYGGQPTATDTQQKVKAQPIRVDKKVGRNDPCPCGSGKKFKNCHGTEE
jgi:preprotein translocase subunit SecA